MFFHNLKYTFKTLLKNKSLIFWTFAFPLILGSLFYLAFKDIEKKEQFEVIDIAIIENETWEKNEIWKIALNELSTPGENQLFKVLYTDEETAKKLLEEEKITGFLNLEKEKELTVKKSGINETILKYATEEIGQTKIIFQNIIEQQIKSAENSEILEETIKTTIDKISNLKKESTINIKDDTSKNLSYTMIEYYTLIAMTCLYGGILGIVATEKNLANMGSIGKRIASTPTTKKVTILSSVMASYMIQLIGILLLFLYTIFILHVDYGSHFLFVVLLTLVGCLTGLSIGIFLASCIKARENTKTGILLAITMFGCFLSGMMGITMKYIIDKNIPILNRINPANLITDGFYSLYYYDTMDRFYKNIAGLLIIAILLILLSIFFLRRQKYDNL